MRPSLAVSLLALFCGLMLSGVAGYFSIVGLATIFAGAFWSVVVMGSALEVSKLVAASWVYRHWRIAPKIMKTYMTTSVVVLILITSMGIFGYLSKAHIEQTVVAGDNTIRIEQIDNRISRERKRIEDAERVIAQLDDAVETLIEYDRIRGPDGSIAVRESQQGERDSLNAIIDEASNNMIALQDEKAVLSKEQLEIEAEVGPLKYIAELIYGDQARDYFDKAVRYIIILIVSVFDPLAITLLLAGNHGVMHRHEKFKEGKAYVELTEDDIQEIEEEEVQQSRGSVSDEVEKPSRKATYVPRDRFVPAGEKAIKTTTTKVGYDGGSKYKK